MENASAGGLLNTLVKHQGILRNAGGKVCACARTARSPPGTLGHHAGKGSQGKAAGGAGARNPALKPLHLVSRTLLREEGAPLPLHP